MADGYLEKRYEEVFGPGAKKTVVKHTSIDTLFEKNRSYRGYQKDFVVKREMLERIVAVNTRIASAKNQQVLRFKLVTKKTGADVIVQNMKLGGLLPELHLPFAGTEPEAFIIICSTIPENKFVDIDLGIAAQSMLLKATEMGLNGIMIGAFNKAKITEAFQLPCEPLLILAFTLLLVPIFDTTRVILVRIRHRQHVFRSDKNHIHHKLMRTGMNQRQVLLTIILLDIGYIILNQLLYCFCTATVVLVIDIMLWIVLNYCLNHIIISKGGFPYSHEEIV